MMTQGETVNLNSTDTTRRRDGAAEKERGVNSLGFPCCFALTFQR